MEEHKQDVVDAQIRQPRKISPFWILPIVAFIVGALLFFQILKEQGETITIRFAKGDGITAGKTVIRYQGLQIGQVKRVYFVDNLKEVEVQAEINPEAKSVLREDTKFWLVHPSASLAGVSGLDAIVSGNYITLLPGEGEFADEFIAEEDPPAVTVSDGDLLIRLVSDDLGSITVGASIYFRKMPVGSIADYRFTKDQKQIEIDVIINKKYANLVKKDSRFWNISGITTDVNLQGIKVNIDSLASVVQGAIAYDSPDDTEAAEQGQVFNLYPDLKSAKRGIEVNVQIPLISNLKLNEKIDTKSNLNFKVLKEICEKININIARFEEYETELNQLVSIRNSISHGENAYNFNTYEAIDEYQFGIQQLVEINKKQKALALHYAINAHAEKGSLFVADSIAVESGKTKEAVSIISSLNQRDTLVIVNSIEEKTYLAFRNIKNCYMIERQEVNAYLIAAYHSVLVEKSVLDSLTKEA